MSEHQGPQPDISPGVENALNTFATGYYALAGLDAEYDQAAQRYQMEVAQPRHEAVTAIAARLAVDGCVVSRDSLGWNFAGETLHDGRPVELSAEVSLARPSQDAELWLGMAVVSNWRGQASRVSSPQLFGFQGEVAQTYRSLLLRKRPLNYSYENVLASPDLGPALRGKVVERGCRNMLSSGILTAKVAAQFTGSRTIPKDILNVSVDFARIREDEQRLAQQDIETLKRHAGHNHVSLGDHIMGRLPDGKEVAGLKTFVEFLGMCKLVTPGESAHHQG